MPSISREVSWAEKQRYPDAPLYVALHELHVWEERRRELFKMNVELEWFEKSATKRPYSWEHVPEAGRTTQHAHDAPVVTIARLPTVIGDGGLQISQSRERSRVLV